MKVTEFDRKVLVVLAVWGRVDGSSNTAFAHTSSIDGHEVGVCQEKEGGRSKPA